MQKQGMDRIIQLADRIQNELENCRVANSQIRDKMFMPQEVDRYSLKIVSALYNLEHLAADLKRAGRSPSE